MGNIHLFCYSDNLWRTMKSFQKGFRNPFSFRNLAGSFPFNVSDSWTGIHQYISYEALVDLFGSVARWYVEPPPPLTSLHLLFLCFLFRVMIFYQKQKHPLKMLCGFWRIPNITCALSLDPDFLTEDQSHWDFGLASFCLGAALIHAQHHQHGGTATDKALQSWSWSKITSDRSIHEPIHPSIRSFIRIFIHGESSQCWISSAPLGRQSWGALSSQHRMLASLLWSWVMGLGKKPTRHLCQGPRCLFDGLNLIGFIPMSFWWC